MDKTQERDFLHLNEFDEMRAAGKYRIPTIRAEEFVPSHLISMRRCAPLMQRQEYTSFWMTAGLSEYGRNHTGILKFCNALHVYWLPIFHCTWTCRWQ